MRAESSAGNTERNSEAACSGCEKTYLNSAMCGLDTRRSLPSRFATAHAVLPVLFGKALCSKVASGPVS